MGKGKMPVKDLLRLLQSEMSRLSQLPARFPSSSFTALAATLASSPDLYLHGDTYESCARLGLSYCSIAGRGGGLGAGGNNNNTDPGIIASPAPGSASLLTLREEPVRRKTLCFLLLRRFRACLGAVIDSIGADEGEEAGGVTANKGTGVEEAMSTGSFLEGFLSEDAALWALSEDSLWSQHFEQRRIRDKDRDRGSQGRGRAGTSEGPQKDSSPVAEVPGAEAAPTRAEPASPAEPLRAGDLLRMKGRKYLEAKSAAQLDQGQGQGLGGNSSTPGGASGGKGSHAGLVTPSGSSSGSSPFSSSASTAGSDFSFSRFFGFGKDKDRDSGGTGTGTGLSTPSGGSKAGRNTSNSPMQTPSAPRISSTNVLFVQSKSSLVVVESTPKSIADDSYCVLNAAPLACAKATLDREDPRKVKIIVSITCNDLAATSSSPAPHSRGLASSRPPHSQLRCMHSEGVPSLELELERGRLARELVIGGSSSFDGHASASTQAHLSDLALAPALVDLGYSPVAIPQVYPPAELPRSYSVTMTFESEKVCRLARDHVTVKGREVRASQQAGYLDLLRDAIASTRSGRES